MGYVDDLKRLAAKFEANHRYANFGPVVERMDVSGFRGVDQLGLEIFSPVTAISGLNGTGKSTLAQLLICAYKRPSTAALKRYYVKDFFPVSAADPTPFTPGARVVFSYCVERSSEPQRVTVTRAKTEWSGYQRQPERACYYVGFTQFIPKVERRDFSIYSGALVQLGDTRQLDQGALNKVSAILGISYDALGFLEVRHRERTTELATASRSGRAYSENHMGFGEGRVVYMVNAMETAPAQSLFVLEEPETSLHGDAQEHLAEYFIDVSNRRGHQILLTTHSSSILNRLSRKSILYLRRSPADYSLSITPGLAAYQIDSFLRGSRGPTTRVVCVEDEFAKCLAIEGIRCRDAGLLAGCNFVCVGGASQMEPAITLLKQSGIKAAGLLDGDQPSPSPLIACLPGTLAPEAEVFGNVSVRDAIAQEFDVDVSEVLAGQADPHRFCDLIAERAMVASHVIAQFACRAYARSDVSKFEPIVEVLRRELVVGI